MHAIVSSDQLRAALDVASSLAATRHYMPVLHNVRIEAGRDGVVIEATDLDTGVRIAVRDAEVKSPGVVLLNNNTSRKMAAGLISDASEIRTGDTAATVKSGPNVFSLPTAAPDDWPKWEDAETEHRAVVSAADLHAALKGTERFTAVEKGRYALNGVLIEASAKHVEVVACDERHFVYRRIKSAGLKALPFQTIVPRNAISVLLKALSDATGEATLLFSESRLGIDAGGTRASARLVEGCWPDYRSALPQASPFRAQFEVKPTLAAVRTAGAFTSIESQAVQFDFAPGRLVMRAKSSAHGASEIETPVDYDGPPKRVGLDPVYVADAIAALGGDRAWFEFTDSETGVFIDAGERDDEFTFVMPIYLEDATNG